MIFLSNLLCILPSFLIHLLQISLRVFIKFLFIFFFFFDQTMKTAVKIFFLIFRPFFALHFIGSLSFVLLFLFKVFISHLVFLDLVYVNWCSFLLDFAQQIKSFPILFQNVTFMISFLKKSIQGLFGFILLQKRLKFLLFLLFMPLLLLFC